MRSLKDNTELLRYKQNLLDSQDKRFQGEQVLVIRWLPSNLLFEPKNEKCPENHLALPYKSNNLTLSSLYGTSKLKLEYEHEIILKFDWNDTKRKMKKNLTYFKYPKTPKQLTINQYKKYNPPIWNLYHTRDSEGNLYRNKLFEGLCRIKNQTRNNYHT